MPKLELHKLTRTHSLTCTLSLSLSLLFPQFLSLLLPQNLFDSYKQTWMEL